MMTREILTDASLKKHVKRREVLKLLGLSIMGGSLPARSFASTFQKFSAPVGGHEDNIKDYLLKMKHFDSPYKDDVIIGRDRYPVFTSTVNKLRRLEKFVGHGRYQVLDFDLALKYGKNYPSIGEFTPEEKGFMEEVFYRDASEYGFYGERTLPDLTDKINDRDVVYVPGQGQHLFKGHSYEKFKHIRSEVGSSVTLTSGVRGVMKQFLLFLNKADRSEGNLSLASRSLAPPGYSFHAKGDFDVGQSGYGALNFTDKFVRSDVYHTLCDLGYLKLRYELNNQLGVRFEPWHIRLT